MIYAECSCGSRHRFRVLAYRRYRLWRQTHTTGYLGHSWSMTSTRDFSRGVSGD